MMKGKELEKWNEEFRKDCIKMLKKRSYNNSYKNKRDKR